MKSVREQIVVQNLDYSLFHCKDQAFGVICQVNDIRDTVEANIWNQVWFRIWHQGWKDLSRKLINL